MFFENAIEENKNKKQENLRRQKNISHKFMRGHSNSIALIQLNYACHHELDLNALQYCHTCIAFASRGASEAKQDSRTLSLDVVMFHWLELGSVSMNLVTVIIC